MYRPHYANFLFLFCAITNKKKIYEGELFNVERFNIFLIYMSVRRGRDGMVVGCTPITTV